jgi:hypothetical protein
MAACLGSLWPLCKVLQHFGAGGTMSPKSPMGIWMFGWVGSLGAPGPGHTSQMGALASLLLTSLPSNCSIALVLLCCSDGQLSLGMGVICFG